MGMSNSMLSYQNLAQNNYHVFASIHDVQTIKKIISIRSPQYLIFQQYLLKKHNNILTVIIV